MSFMKRDRDPYRPTAVPTPTQPAQTPAPAQVSSTGQTGLREPSAPSAVDAAHKAELPAPRPAIPPANREAAAVIDKKSEIKGTLRTEGNVLVEGCFQGEIDAKETVWVENGAQIQSQVRANDVIVSGTFNGEIDCRHRLQITASASISGEIKTPILVIEEGATVNCKFSMTRSGGTK